MTPIKTAWRILVSPFLAVAWVAVFVLLYAGWGEDIADKFIKAWNSMYEDCKDEDDGPVTGGPLPPDPVETRKSGQDIG